MSAVPRIVTRVEQQYAAIGARAAIPELAGLGAFFGEVLAWLDDRGVKSAGPPFFRYLTTGMDGDLELEAGVPVAAAMAGDDRVTSGLLPAGRYATFTHVGPPAELAGAGIALLSWAAGKGLTWDSSTGENAEHWGCRLETHLTDPAQEPDMRKWETELAIRLAD